MTNDPTAKVHQKKFILEDTNQKSQANLADLTQIPMQYNILAKHKSQQDIASQVKSKFRAPTSFCFCRIFNSLFFFWTRFFFQDAHQQKSGCVEYANFLFMICCPGI